MNGLFREGSLGSILFRSGIITEADIGAALDEQRTTGCRFGEALVTLGIVTQEDIDWALSSQLEIAYVRLKKEMIDPEAVALVPGEVARRHGVVPILRVGDELTLALADPLDKGAVEEVERVTGCRVTIAVALGREIREMLDLLYTGGAGKDAVFSSAVLPAAVVAAINDDPTGNSLTDHILSHASGHGSASVSLWPQGETVAVIARGAESAVIGTLDAERYPEVVRGIRRLAGCDPAAPSVRGRLSSFHDGREETFDVSIVTAASGDFVTFHRVCSSPFPATLDGLRLTAEKTALLTALLDDRQGTLLVGGNAATDFLGLIIDRKAASGRGAVIASHKLVAGRPGLLGLVAAPEATPAMLAAALEQAPEFIVVEEIVPIAGAELVKASDSTPVVAGIPADGLTGGAAFLSALVRATPAAGEIVRGIVLLNRVPLLCPDCRKEAAVPAAAAPYLPEGATVFSAPGCSRCGLSGRSGEQYFADILTLPEELRNFLRTMPAPEQLLPRLREEGACLSHDEGKELLASGDLAAEDFVSILLL